MKLNLGCGTNILKGWVNVDISPLPGVDKCFDISLSCNYLLFEDNSVDEFLLSHILEHIADPLPMMQELWRIAKPDAIMHIAVPHGANDMAFADPQHVRQYFPSSFQFFAQPAYKRADYGYLGDWECEEVVLKRHIDFPPDDPLLNYYIMHARNYFSEMKVNLRAVKPGRSKQLEWTYAPAVGIE